MSKVKIFTSIIFIVVFLFISYLFLSHHIKDTLGVGTSASDTFTRTTSSGWGTANTGGDWTPVTGTTADFSTNGSGGVVSVGTAGANRAAYLNSVSAQDVNILVRFKTNKVASGGVERVYLVGRRISSGNEYRGRITINTSGSVQLQATALVSSSETVLGSAATVSGLTFASDTYIYVRFTLTGTSPTAIQMKAWLDGNSEPGSYNYTSSDSSSVLQTPGAVGIQSTLAAGASNAPVVFTYDDYTTTNNDPTPTPTPTTAVLPTPTPGGDPIIGAAGDIACGSATPGGASCKYAETSNLLVSINPNAVLPLGDIQYEQGELSDFNTYYHSTWGRLKNATYPVIGNHEYLSSSGADGYFDYYNGSGVTTGAAGTRGQGYYSYDLGAWHLIALNSNCTPAGGCGAGSNQETWLRSDLAANRNKCTLAYFHHPYFSSGEENRVTAFLPLLEALYEYRADVMLSGHDHSYERFALQDPQGNATSGGIKQFVVGTGGRNHTSFGVSGQIANSEIFDDTSFGVIKMNLHATSYDWQFIPASGFSFTDSGTQNCHIATTSTSSTSNSNADPNSFQNWKYSITVGPHYIGVPGYIFNSDNTILANVSNTAFHDDVLFTIQKLSPGDFLQNNKLGVFPWAQGFNIVSDIVQFKALSSFNGYPVNESDKPFSIILTYDFIKLGGISPKSLRLIWFDTSNSRWRALPQNTVLNEQTRTIANTTTNTGFYAVGYSR